MRLQCLHKQRNIFRIVLTIAVDGDGIVEAFFLRPLKACQQCVALSFVLSIIDGFKGNVRELLQLLSCIVSTAVDDDDDMLRKGCNALDDSGNRLAVVVGWHYHTDLTLLHHLLYIRHHRLFLDAPSFATLLVEEHD